MASFPIKNYLRDIFQSAADDMVTMVEKIEAPTYRYKIRTSQMGVEAEVAPSRRPGQILCMSMFAIMMIGVAVFLGVFVGDAALIGSILMGLMAACDLFLLSWALFGYERLLITQTTLTFDWQMFCIRRVKNYALTHVGPIEKVTTTYNDEGTTRTHTYWAFQYGGKKIPFMPNITPDEMPVFLRDIGPYLPPHIKPINC